MLFRSKKSKTQAADATRERAVNRVRDRSNVGSAPVKEDTTSEKDPVKHLSDLLAKEYAKKKITDKSGAVHTPMSRARHLARMAMQKQMEKMKKPVKESLEESRKAQIVKEIMKKKTKTEDTFQKDPELSSSLTKNQ